MSTAILPDIDLEVLFHSSVPCSGAMHGADPDIHGDPELPAEYLIRAACPRCLNGGRRPVCKYFALIYAKNEKQPVFCRQCWYRGPATEFFTDLKPL